MSERTTKIVSALVALAILGLGVTAQPTADPTSGRIEALESDLRFQIEMSWRHDGRTREAREAQLAKTLAAWEASPQTGPDRQLLEKWLRGAIVGSLPGESGEFPPTPAFNELIVEAEKPAVVQRPDARPPVLPRVVEPPQTLKPKTPKANANANAAQPSKPRDIQLKPGQAYTPPRAKEFRITPRAPGGGQAAPSGPQTAEQQSQPAPSIAAAPPTRVVAAKPVEIPPANPAPKHSAESAKTLPATQPAAPATLAPPAATPLRSAPATVESVPAESEPVTVNLAELNAQIGGYHDGLDEIEAMVVAGGAKLTEGEVARLVGQLEQLAGQHQFVRLYYDGLSKSEKRFVAAPRSMRETIELVEGQRAALVAEEEDFLTALEDAAAEDELARRLKAVAAEVGADRAAEPQDESDR